MSKAVLISTRPKECDKIAKKEQTIVVKKIKPTIETPFKCYIYCTKGVTTSDNLWITDLSGYNHLGNGKVIGEFICDAISSLSFDVKESGTSFFDTEPPFTIPGSCLTDREIAKYLGIWKTRYGWHITGYGWHISDLKIYDESKELSEFCKPCKHDCWGCEYYTFSGLAYDPSYCDWERYIESPESIIKRPPQSWCYAETKI